jgi:hypothetical protein
MTQASKANNFSRPATPATGELNFFRSCGERRPEQILDRRVQQIENPYREKSE